MGNIHYANHPINAYKIIPRIQLLHQTNNEFLTDPL